MKHAHRLICITAITLLTSSACSPTTTSHPKSETLMEPSDQTGSQPPEHIRAWMDRLTVEHEYDPQTGFIVAREVIALPEVIRNAPSLEEGVAMTRTDSVRLVVFATADRCAPCQQYKKSALNDPAVIEALQRPGLIVAHIEVDRNPELAQTYVGSVAIPMTYLIEDGVVVSELRGQRSAEDLLAWLPN